MEQIEKKIFQNLGEYIYKPMVYREKISSDDLDFFTMEFGQSNIQIGVDKEKNSLDLQQACKEVLWELYLDLQRYLLVDKSFEATLEWCRPVSGAPQIIRHMSEASKKARVGPMASVAGAFAEHMGKKIQKKFKLNNIIIENGGDIWLNSEQDRSVALYAGESVFADRIKIVIDKEMCPLGICTSSGTVGHSLSFGKADAVTVIAKSSAVADAFATSIGNKIKNPDDIDIIIACYKPFLGKEIEGIAIVMENKIGAIGNVKFAPIA